MSEGFTSLQLSRETMAALKGVKLNAPTALQSKVIPHALLGRDIVATSVADASRTDAILLSLIERLAAMHNARALILARNKARVAEIHQRFDELSAGRSYKVTEILAGGSIPAQEAELREKRTLLLAMPGRLTEHMARGAVNFSNIEIVVLDAADDLIADGLITEVKRIVQRLPPRRQTLIFANALPESLNGFTKTALRDPILINVKDEPPAAPAAPRPTPTLLIEVSAPVKKPVTAATPVAKPVTKPAMAPAKAEPKVEPKPAEAKPEPKKKAEPKKATPGAKKAPAAKAAKPASKTAAPKAKAKK